MTLEQAHKKALKREVIAECMKNAERRIIPMVTTGMNAARVMVLHDEFGFGEKRMVRALERVKLQFDALNGDNVKIDDMVQTIKAELGIDLTEGEE